MCYNSKTEPSVSLEADIGISNVQKSDNDSSSSSDIQKPHTHWRSIYVAATVTYVGAVQFSLYAASMFPYLQVMDKTSTENFFGLIISMYSLAQIISSPLVGYWSNKTHETKSCLYFGLVTMFFGNVLYFFAGIIPFQKKYVILVARFITGFGSSNVSLLKAYAISASTGSDRSKAIAYVTGALALGMLTGPGLQLFFTPLGPHGIQLSNNLFLNIYTAPAIMACTINILGVLLIYFFFIERTIGIPDKKKIKETGVALPPFDTVAVIVCYVTRFCQMFIVTNLESIGTPLAMTMFAWNRPQVVRNAAIAHVFQSFLAFLIYALYIKYNLGKKLNSKKVTMISLGGLILFHLLSYSWPFLPGSLKTYDEFDYHNANDTELAGCNVDRFDWCYSLKPVNVYLYYISSVILIGTCFPNINISLNTLFSKIIGPRPQGTQQGWLQVAGSSARMIGPVSISALYTKYGPRWSWNIEIAVITFTLFLWVLLRKRMVPLNVPEIYAEFQDQNDPDIKKKINGKINS